MRDQVRDAPIEVEAERLDPGEEEGEPRGGPHSGAGPRVLDWGPIVAGLFLDLADLATPRSGKAGLAIGAVVGYLAGAKLKLPMKGRLALAAIGAAYCSFAATTTLPLGTMLGFLYKAGLFGRRR